MENNIPSQTPITVNNPKDAPALTYREIRMPKYKRWVRWMWRAYVGGLALLVVFFTWQSFLLPSFEQLENPRSRIASEIYSTDGEMMGKYYIENRTPVPYDSLSPYLVNAVVATEDARFYTHSGIDPEALLRVAVKTFLFQQEGAGGGSTISQQLAKLLVGRPNTKGRWLPARYWMLFTTKIREWLTAVKLERSYTKQEIIAMYFNEFDFLYGACGIKSAAEIYFGKTPSNLTLSEAATLVRMLKNPSLYNPRRDMERAIAGRNTVLELMKANRFISESEETQSKALPIDLSKFKVRDHNEGTATYFREYLREHVSQILENEECRRPDGSKYDLYQDGLKIYTTIDARLQHHAELAAWNHLKDYQRRMFEHWPAWNGDMSDTKNTSKNPWLDKGKATPIELSMRLLSLERLVWETERFQSAKEEYLKTALKLGLRELNIYHLLELEKAQKTATKDNNPETIMANWVKVGYATQDQISTYRRLMGSSDWNTIKQEYINIMNLMKKPVPMKIFAYNAKGEKDTVMSPFDSIRYHRMHMQTGMMAMDPFTGYVKAWVGGINHKYFKYDHVNRRAKRQVGSSIKPFLYALAVNHKHYSSCHKVLDAELTIEKGYARFDLQKPWTPKNAGGSYSNQEVTLTQALTQSLNSVSASLMKEFGSVAPMRNFLADIGIDTTKVPISPTICLGTPDISVFEMTGAYTMFANGGYYVEPIFIERIEDKNGNPIYVAEADQHIEQVLSEQSAYVMNQMLQAVQRSAGGFNGIRSAHGGKTGTTNYQADGWFMGFTPTIVVGTWVGCDDRFIRFRNLGLGQGGKMARPIFQNFLRYVEADPKTGYNILAQFPRPDVIQLEQDCGKFNSNFGTEDLPDDVTNPNVYNPEYD